MSAVSTLLCAYLQVSQLLCAKEQLEFDMAAQQAQADELATSLEALRAQVWLYKTKGWFLSGKAVDMLYNKGCLLSACHQLSSACLLLIV